MKNMILLFTTISLFFSFSGNVLSQDETQKKPEFAGEFFAMPVPLENYYFVKGVIMVFGNKWGPQPKTQEPMSYF